mgnify:FL=1
MATRDSDSGSEFGDYIRDLVRDRDDALGVDDQSDVSVSSVHTDDLSDFDSNVSFSSDDDDDLVDSDAEWVVCFFNLYLKKYR